ncbi:hypothetical protein [Rossellomorea marisflavi]|uniref:hypothetical protein n=1 Tax=Rossellomorea marisflavi TaxID=189381 RepID=UPI003F9FE108
MKETIEVAKNGMKDIEAFLSSFSSSLSVINVEDHPLYQKKDIDLLWVYLENGRENMKRIELKVDRYTSGNFFFETASNVGKGTNGCFMYTESDYLFYYFVQWKRLYILPVEEVRDWFKENESRFVEKSLGTKIGNKQAYESKGRLVPIEVVLKECPGVKLHCLK